LAAATALPSPDPTSLSLAATHLATAATAAAGTPAAVSLVAAAEHVNQAAVAPDTSTQGDHLNAAAMHLSNAATGTPAPVVTPPGVTPPPAGPPSGGPAAAAATASGEFGFDFFSWWNRIFGLHPAYQPPIPPPPGVPLPPPPQSHVIPMTLTPPAPPTMDQTAYFPPDYPDVMMRDAPPPYPIGAYGPRNVYGGPPAPYMPPSIYRANPSSAGYPGWRQYKPEEYHRLMANPYGQTVSAWGEFAGGRPPPPTGGGSMAAHAAPYVAPPTGGGSLAAHPWYASPPVARPAPPTGYAPQGPPPPPGHPDSSAYWAARNQSLGQNGWDNRYDRRWFERRGGYGQQGGGNHWWPAQNVQQGGGQTYGPSMQSQYYGPPPPPPGAPMPDPNAMNPYVDPNASDPSVQDPSVDAASAYGPGPDPLSGYSDPSAT
jgi:hypothetical protein